MSSLRIFLFDIVDICHLSIFYACLLNCLALSAVRQPPLPPWFRRCPKETFFIRSFLFSLWGILSGYWCCNQMPLAVIINNSLLSNVITLHHMVKNKDFCAPEKIICHVLQKLFRAICTGGNNFSNYYFLANVKELGRKCFVGEKGTRGDDSGGRIYPR